MLGDEERALQVDGERPVESRLVHGLHILGEQDARVGEDNIEPAVLGQQAVHACCTEERPTRRSAIGSDTSATTTAAPSWLSRSASIRPIPLEPPVTSATFPSNRRATATDRFRARYAARTDAAA